MLERAWTLIATRKPQPMEEAERLLEQVWELRNYQTPLFQLDLAKKMAVLRSQQHRFEEAETWLKQAEELWRSAELYERERLQELIQIQYYWGMNHFSTNEIEQARQCFESSRENARSLEWERAIRMAENWLADIAVMMGQLDEAERLLLEGLRTAEAYGDPTRVAFVKRSMAGLMRARGDSEEARCWAEEAWAGFDQLGMQYEGEEVQGFRASL
jgi:tetratricopeptide (TPR) repeat protein